MTLGGAKQKDMQVYMMWFQIRDPYESEKLERDYFESLSCSLLFRRNVTETGFHI